MLDEDLVPLGRVERLPGRGTPRAGRTAASCTWTPPRLPAWRFWRTPAAASRARCCTRWTAAPARADEGCCASGSRVRCGRRRRQGAPGSRRGPARRRAGRDGPRARSCARRPTWSARLRGWCRGGRAGRDVRIVVLYEDARAERRQGFLAALDAVKAAAEAANAFDAATRAVSRRPRSSKAGHAGRRRRGRRQGRRRGRCRTPEPDRTLRGTLVRRAQRRGDRRRLDAVARRDARFFRARLRLGRGARLRARRAQTRRRRCRGRRGRAPRRRGRALDAWSAARARPGGGPRRRRSRPPTRTRTWWRFPTASRRASPEPGPARASARASSASTRRTWRVCV